MFLNDNGLFFGLLSISVAKLAALFVCRRKKLEKFEKVGKIGSIYLYPLKSGAPIILDSAVCTTTGLLYDKITDRTWMVIRKNGAFLSARQEPKLVLIKPTTDGDTLCLDAPGMPTLVLPKYPKIDKSSRFIKCRVWDDNCTGLFCGEEADEWIRKYLGNNEASMVVSTPTMVKRDSSQTYKPTGNPAMKGDLASFPDWGPYMVLSEASLDDLNTRLEKKVTMIRFRPNITVAGCSPYDEDNWSEMRIGDHVFIRLLDFCPRCVMTTVDPEKGERDTINSQPLKTLRSYRYMKDFQEACFGVNAAVDIGGEIKVGDPVYVIRKNS